MVVIQQINEFALERNSRKKVSDKTGFIKSYVNSILSVNYSSLMENILELVDAVGYQIELNEKKIIKIESFFSIIILQIIKP